MGDAAGRQAVEWLRTRNPWASATPWIRSHPLRMYALGVAAPWVQPSARFLIVTPGRTGSEMLADLLNSHPDIVCEAEILRTRVALPERFVDGRSGKAGLGGAQAYGFKIHCGHFGYQVLREQPRYLSELSGEGWTLLFLQRENFLAQAISSTIASRTRWHWRQRDAATFSPLELDPVEVLMMTYLFEESDQYLATLLDGLPHLNLSYERDLVDTTAQQTTVDRICALLGLPSAPTSSDHVRFTPRRLSETISNFDQVADLIRPTRFRRFLSEDEDEDEDEDEKENENENDAEAESGHTASMPAASTSPTTEPAATANGSEPAAAAGTG